MIRVYLLAFALTALAFGEENAEYGKQNQCGKVRKLQTPLAINLHPTLEGQWPWHVAVYQTQKAGNRYICGGTLVSNHHVITVAQCVTKKSSNKIVNKNSLTIYLGKHNLISYIEGMQIRLLEGITIHPEYNASSFFNNLAILELKQPVSYSEWVQPACLWPEDQIDLSNVIEKTGSVVSWSADESGNFDPELKHVEMSIVDQETCIRSYAEFFIRFTSSSTFCAGNSNGETLCSGSSGSGIVLNNDGTWYLRGLVSIAIATPDSKCDPSHYIVFTDLAKFLPWIKEHVSDY